MTTVSTGKCMLCDQPSEVEVPDELADKVRAYKANPQRFGLIQEEFPMLNAAQRELILTGSHDECFTKAFPEEEE